MAGYGKQSVGFGLVAVFFLLLATEAAAVRLKDLASIQGVRDNQLVGYGLVVGLDGTGDGKQAKFTSQSLANMMRHLGVQVNKDDINVKNVASVMVTAQLPPFAKAGQVIDVTLSSLGDASSLQGGTLMPTSLQGLDNQVYAICQGPVSVGGFEEAGATPAQKKHLTVARIPGGATVEREVPVQFANKDSLTLSLKNADFTTVMRVVEEVNSLLGGPYAAAVDGATVTVRVPQSYQGQEISLLAALEALEVTPDMPARVVLDERTGTVVMGEHVRIGEIALSHGNLSLQVSQGAGNLRTPTTEELLNSPKTDELLLEKKDVPQPAGSKLVTLPAGVSLGEVVRALNSMGVSPRDMIAIFQTIKAAGALQAELEII